MSMKLIAALSACATSLAAAVAFSPLAHADDEPCTSSDTVTVCDSDGSASIVATPPQIGDGVQNGPYGPAGDVAPVGGEGL